MSRRTVGVAVVAVVAGVGIPLFAFVMLLQVAHDGAGDATTAAGGLLAGFGAAAAAGASLRLAKDATVTAERATKALAYARQPHVLAVLGVYLEGMTGRPDPPAERPDEDLLLTFTNDGQGTTAGYRAIINWTDQETQRTSPRSNLGLADTVFVNLGRQLSYEEAPRHVESIEVISTQTRPRQSRSATRAGRTRWRGRSRASGSGTRHPSRSAPYHA